MNLDEYKYKIETHTHTSPASSCADFKPWEVVEKYAAIGFDALVITNHFSLHSFRKEKFNKIEKKFMGDFYDAQNAALKYGIKVILGMEIRFPQNSNDYLVYGIDKSDLKLLYDLTHTDYATFYKTFKNDKNVILQAHPFRNGIVCENPDLLDGIETFNMHPVHNSRIGVAAQYAKKFPHFITTCGSDFHNDGQQGLGGILTKTLPNDSYEMASILKSKDYLFNISGNVVIP